MHQDKMLQKKYPAALKSLKHLALTAFGAALGLGAALWATDISHPFLLASIGGSTVFLFGLANAPAAQPRALFGGHLGGALIGIACYQLFGNALWVYILSVVLSMVYMLSTRTVHPPAGANPLLMVHNHADISALWQPLGISVILLACTAFIWTRLVPGMPHYPVKWMDQSPPSIPGSGWED